MRGVRALIGSLAEHPVRCLGLILLCYFALLLPTVGRQGISWDEQTDIDIARPYLAGPDGWLRGSDSDPSQTRLPMAVVAAVYTVLRTDDLFTARVVSCVVGALTIVGVFVLCKRDFDGKRGLLAGAILATSPFFLSFARTAFTETDIYVACAFVWLLVAMSHLRESGSVGWAAVTGVVLGLALSGKATTVVVLPAIVVQILSVRQDPRREPLSRHESRSAATLLALMCAAALFGWFSLSTLARESREDALLRFHFLLGFTGWVAVLVWAARHREWAAPPLFLGGFALTLALGTFMVLPPEHLTNPAIISSLTDRFGREMTWNPAFAGEAAALHLASVVFKSSPTVGVGLLVSVIAAAWQWGRRPEVGLPLMIVVLYFLGLVLLPLAQTFYMVPLLPLLAVLAADGLLTLWARRRILAAGIGIAAAAGLCVDLALCYPDFNLNGYQWLGARYIANRSTIGYRSVVQTTSDGVQQVAQWLNENAGSGDRVAVYVYPWHILAATCPDPPFRLIPGQWNPVHLGPDYVVVHINHTLRQRWATYFTGSESNARASSVWWEPYDTTWVQAHYTKVAAVRRAFGIEMASVWERNDRRPEK